MSKCIRMESAHPIVNSNRGVFGTCFRIFATRKAPFQEIGVSIKKVRNAIPILARFIDDTVKVGRVSIICPLHHHHHHHHVPGSITSWPSTGSTSTHSEHWRSQTCKPPVESRSRIVMAPESVYAPIPRGMSVSCQFPVNGSRLSWIVPLTLHSSLPLTSL